MIYRSNWFTFFNAVSLLQSLFLWEESKNSFCICTQSTQGLHHVHVFVFVSCLLCNLHHYKLSLVEWVRSMPQIGTVRISWRPCLDPEIRDWSMTEGTKKTKWLGNFQHSKQTNYNINIYRVVKLKITNHSWVYKLKKDYTETIQDKRYTGIDKRYTGIDTLISKHLDLSTQRFELKMLLKTKHVTSQIWRFQSWCIQSACLKSRSRPQITLQN